MGRIILFAVGGGAVSALCVLSAAFGSPGAIVVTYLTPLPLFVVGLSLGATGALVAAASGLFAVAVLGGATAVIGYAAGCALPVVLVTRQALLTRSGAAGAAEWYPSGRLLLWLVGYGVVGILAAAVTAAGVDGGLRGAIESVLAAEQPLLAVIAGPEADRLTWLLAWLAPGIVAGSWVVMTALNAVLAQWVVMRLHRNLRPAWAMADIDLPEWTVTALAAAAATAYLVPGTVGYLAFNASMVVGLAFFFVGLGVIHAVLRGRRARPLLLAVFYVVLLVQGWMVVLVAGLGVIEQWANFRRRFAAAGPD